MFFLAALFSGQAQAQTFTVLYAFQGGPDGAQPWGGLVMDRAGNLYGITNTGGRYSNGVVYKIRPSGEEKVLHQFLHAEGLGAMGSLILDDADHLYGTTTFGGYGAGTVFELFKGGKLRLLHRFAEADNNDGHNPYAGVVQDAAGNLYGAAPYGGDYGWGAVYKVDPSGKEMVLHSFSSFPDGAYPYGGVTLDTEGNLYGTTEDGGLYGAGTVYKLDASGNETVLYNFTGGSDGKSPEAGVIRGDEGNLYGTTYAEGAHKGGVVFKLAPTGTFTVVYSFGEAAGDGSLPYSGVVRDSEGNLYGTTSAGGSYFYGTVYKLEPGGVLTVLHNFTAGMDGGFPFAGVIRDPAGNIYGTTVYGGDSSCSCGLAFRITP
jgi:uncharacterized repeat protein (TIGR03803 family)